MEEGFFNVVTDELKASMKGLRFEVRDMFKGTRPYRMEKTSDNDQIKQYFDFTSDPTKEQELLQQGMPPEAIQNYHLRMRDLIRRKGYA